MPAKNKKQFAKYPSYKPTGVDWLGEIPSEWDFGQIKFIFRIINGATPKSSVEEYWDGEIPWATPIDLGKNSGMYLSSTERNITEAGYKSCGTTKAPAHSIILSTRAPIGHLAVSNKEMCINQGCKILVKNHSRVDYKFYYYLFSVIKPVLESFGQGSTFLELSGSKLASLKFPFLNSIEQLRISTFLDKETEKIDKLLEKKQKLIERLKEKRTALISQAVTKGLDPKVKMKDSGISWLGQIPEHWELKKIKHLFSIFNGATPKSEVGEYWDGDILWATPNDLGKNVGPFIKDTERKITSLGYKSCGTSLAPKFSLVISTRAPIGHLAISNDEICVNQGCKILSTKTRTDFKFYYYLVLILKSELISYGQGSTFIELSSSKLQVLKVPFPDIGEQNKIAEYLDKISVQIDIATAKILYQIEKIKEYRTALISAAVTGKIKI